MDSERKLGDLCSFESENEWEPTRFVPSFLRVIGAGHFTKAISCLGATGRGRKKQPFYFLRVAALEVEGRSLKLNMRKRNQ